MYLFQNCKLQAGKFTLIQIHEIKYIFTRVSTTSSQAFGTVKLLTYLIPKAQ